MKSLQTKSLTFQYREPKSGPITKTVFFFSLSAKNSLTLPPFCHPVDTLIQNGVRVVSVTLPCHEENKRPLLIRELWIKRMDEIHEFINDLAAGVKELTNHFPPPYGAMGISRGAFISLHLASLVKDVTSVVCFAPMLSIYDEKDLSIFPLIPKLTEKNIYLFTGHNDTSIGTENVIDLTTKLTKESQGKNPTLFMKMYPSIGRDGHGTPDHIFTEGALWLKDIL